MITLRSLISILPFLSNEGHAKRQADGKTKGPLYAPLKPATTRCYSPDSCIDFTYPAVVLQPSTNVAQAVCSTHDKIIITFANRAAFVTAQKWPIANLVLIGQGYPGCGPDESSRFYAITQSTTANAKSRSISARIVYVERDEVIDNGTGDSDSASLTTTTFTITQPVTLDGSLTTIYSTITETLTILPTLVTSSVPPHSTLSRSSSELAQASHATISSQGASSSTNQSPSSAVGPPVPSPSKGDSSSESSCLTDGQGFYTDNFGITYSVQCNFWTGGESISTLGPGYTAERCLESCSMIFPECGAAVFTTSDGGFCTLQQSLGPRTRLRIGYDTYERVTEHIGKNTTSASSGLEPSSVATMSEPVSESTPSAAPQSTDSESGPAATESSSTFYTTAMSSSVSELDSMVSQPSESSVEPSPESSISAIPMPINSASCPADNNHIFANSVGSRKFQLECDKIVAAEVPATWFQARSIDTCAEACTGACEAFQYGYGNCALYTSVTAAASSSGWTVGTAIASSTHSSTLGPANTASDAETSPAAVPGMTSKEGSQATAISESSVSATIGSSVAPTVSLDVSASRLAPSEASGSPKPLSTNPPCPSSDNTTYVDANGQEYEVHCGNNLVASFLSVMFYVNTDAECLELCDQIDGCVGATHNLAYYNACQMYSAVQDVGAANEQSNAFVLVQASPAVSSMSNISTASPSSLAGPVTCPASNGSIFTYNMGLQMYEIFCDALLETPAGPFIHYRNVRGRTSFASCAALCESSNCPAFVYSGASSACGLYDASTDLDASVVASAVKAITLASAFVGSTAAVSTSAISAYTVEPPYSSTSTMLPASSAMASETSLPSVQSDEASTTSELSTSEPVVSLSASSSGGPAPSALCPYNNDKTFTDAAGRTYNVICNTDLHGGDIGGVRYGLATEQECLEACNSTSGCVGVVFASATCSNNWCHCFLKDVIEPAAYNTNYNSYVMVSEPQPGDSSSIAVESSNSDTPEMTQTSTMLPTEITTSSASSELATVQSSGASPLSTPSGQASASLSCPQDDGTLYPGADGRLFSIGCNRDLRLTYSGRSVEPSFKECLDYCDREGPSCGGVSWVPSGQDQTWCWYKTGREEWSQPPPGITVHSARLANTTSSPDCPSSDGTIYTGPDGTHFDIRCDIDLRGSGVNNGRSIQTDFQACLDSCDARGPAQCYGVSWVPQGQDQQWCYHKVASDPWISAPPGVTVYSARVVEESS